MNFTDLVNEVYSLTNRPDLVNETQSAIRSATLRAHHLDFWPKDLVEQYTGFTEASFYQQLPIQSIPLFRNIKYIRKYYPNGSDPIIVPGNWYYSRGKNLPDGKFFEFLTPEATLDSYGVNKVDVAYLAGATIQIKSGDSFQYVLMGYYQHPNIVPATYTSWIAIEFPYAIVYDAVCTIFKMIGYDEQYQAMQELRRMEYELLQLSSILVEGY